MLSDKPFIKVVAAVIYDKDKVLIARRKPEKIQGGKWEFPGGKIEHEETPELAVVRELREELDIEVDLQSYLGTNMHEYERGIVEIIMYKANFLKGQIKLIDHDEFRWVSVVELPSFDFSEADKYFVSRL